MMPAARVRRDLRRIPLPHIRVNKPRIPPCARHRIQLLGYDGFIAQLGRRVHTMSTEEKNMALVCRFLEAQSKGDLEAQDELLAPGFVDHDLLPGHDPGREGFMQGIAEAHDALSSIRSTIEYQGTDDMVITRHTTRTILDRG